MNKIFHHVQKNKNKHIYLARNFYINVTDYDSNQKVQSFTEYLSQNNPYLVINRPTWRTRTTTTVIDHIFITYFENKTIKTSMIKTNISDHFSIFLTSNSLEECSQKWVKVNFHNHYFHQNNKEVFRNSHTEMNWNFAKAVDHPNLSNKLFIE